MEGATVVKIGTRESQLAMAQTKLVKGLLEKAFPDLTFHIEGMTTVGDKVSWLFLFPFFFLFLFLFFFFSFFSFLG